MQTVVGKTDTNLGTVAALTEQRFFRGMHNDPMPTGTSPRAVKVRDSAGAEIADDRPEFAGIVAESTTFEKDAVNPVIAKREITKPDSRTTSTQTRTDGLPPLHATQVWTEWGTKTEAISGGRSRTVRQNTYVDTAYGLPIRVEDLGDVAKNGDETCTVTTYAHNVAANFLAAVVQERTTAGTCAVADNAPPSHVVGDTRTFFDNQDFGVPPTKGDATRVEVINGSGIGYSRTSATSYDALGRSLAVTDADGEITRTLYEPAEGGTPSRTIVTNPLGYKVTTDFEAGRGRALAKTDENGRLTRTEYDALGRLVKVWMPSRSQGGRSPNIEYEYLARSNLPTVTTSRSLRDDGTYVVSKTLYDGQLRVRQNQVEAVGSGRLVDDILYNSLGGVYRSTEKYLVEGEPADVVYEPVSLTQIRAWTESSYDGQGRTTLAATWYGGGAQADHATRFEYAGDYVVEIPPPGGKATRKTTDALGRTVRLDEFTDPSRSTFASTMYEYDVRGDRTKVTDPSGNLWTSRYDARGQLVESKDPDKGTSVFAYDNSGRQVLATDGRNLSVATAYDALGRKIRLHEGSISGPKIAEWTYDTVPGGKGILTSAVRYHGGHAYINAVTGYDDDYQVTGRRITIPAREGALAGDYVYRYKYTQTGLPAEVELPAAGGLPAERVVTRYTPDGLPVSTSGWDWYTSDTVYNAFGDVLRSQTGGAPSRLWTQNEYDERTGELRKTANYRDAAPYFVNETHYGYDKAGNVTYLKDVTPGAGNTKVDDVQCFNYDSRRMMTDAWTSTNHCASGPTTGPTGTVGGPSPYWSSYTFDAVGNRTSERAHDVTGNATKDIVRVYAYTPASKGNSHRLETVTSTGPGGQRLNTYTYDEVGNTRTRQEDGSTQTLTWGLEGRLDRVDDPTTGATEFVYDADGARLIRKTTQGVTLFLGETEVTVAPNGSVSTDRYYSQAGTPTVVRTTGGLSYLVTDRNNTATTAVSAAQGMAVQRRKVTPFGEDRGTAPQLWPGRRGYVNGQVDDTIGLTHLGAREYDPALGRFISVDPVVDMGDPLQMHAYIYGYNNPVTFSDPDGLWPKIKVPKVIKNAVNKAKETVQQVAPVAHVVLDTVGMVPVIGEAADLANAGLYAAEGDWTNAALSAAGAVPGFGNAVTAAKVADRAADAAQATAKAADNAGDVSKAAPPTKAAPDDGPKSNVDNTKRNETCAVGNSFAPDTGVLMADGTTRPILEVQVGDLVMAEDPVTGIHSARAVVATIGSSASKKVVRLSFSLGGQPDSPGVTPAGAPLVDSSAGGHDGSTSSITTTENHPFWVPRLNDWVDAANLLPGEWLQTSSGTWIQITAVDAAGERSDVRNLTVEGFHTYRVVAAEADVLVHNSNCTVKKELDEFKAWQGRHNSDGWRVYYGYDANDQLIYVGITSRTIRDREAEHIRMSLGIVRIEQIHPAAQNLKEWQAKSIEQVLIINKIRPNPTAHRIKDNKPYYQINSIALSRVFYRWAFFWGSMWLAARGIF